MLSLRTGNTTKQALRFVALYVVCLAIFAISRLCFVWVQPVDVRGALSAGDLLQISLHGLPLDVATAAYLCAPVWLCLGLGLWMRVKGARIIYKVYAVLVAVALSLILVGDACLYRFWNMRIDATVWNYLSQPQGALQSVSMVFALTAVLAVLAVGLAAYWLFVKVFLPANKKTERRRCFSKSRLTLHGRIGWTVAWAICGGLLFLGIRGGVGKSTANVGMAYFSERQFLNHAAVNPAFSLFSSTLKRKDFSKEARYFAPDECRRIFSMLGYNTESVGTDSLLSTPRPNVVLVLMEGCGGTFVHAVDSLSDANVTPNLNRLANEGVVFTQMYANSFRTDRGTVCTLSGCPAFPDLSVMKMPAYCEKLPSIASSLKGAGYNTSFLYGGDINFTNTRGYLQSTGYERIDGEEAFPRNVRKTHDWGVTDRIVFDTLYNRIVQAPLNRPWHIGVLTLASHEPWGVPYNRIKGDQVANSMAYLDHCIGEFVERLRRTPQWKNTLLIFLPDHGIGYPAGLTDEQERRSHIPCIFAGGAVKQSRKVEVICNQTDLAATLLGQLGIAHGDFRLSRDVLSNTYTHPSAVHCWPEGIYYKDNSGISAINILSSPVRTLREVPSASQRRINAAKAFLQTSYDLLDGRK